MTKALIEKTIDELCNVEYGTRVVKKRDAGTTYPVYGGGGETFFLDSYNREDRVVIARFAMSEKCTRRVGGKFALNDSGLTLSPKDSNILRQDYLDYCALSMNDRIYESARGTAQKNLDVPAFRQMILAYPPSLEEQREIVEKFDSAFTEIDELKIETLRLRQANILLTSQIMLNLLNNSGVEKEITTLEKICENLDSQRIPITRDVRTSGEFPYYGASGIIDYVEDFIFEGDALLVSEDGANLLARSTPIAFPVTGKYWVNNHAHILRFEDEDLQKYVEYLLENTKLDQYITGAAQPKLTQRALNSIPISVPMRKSDIKAAIQTISTVKELNAISVSNLDRKLELLDQIKSSLLSAYFESKVA